MHWLALRTPHDGDMPAWGWQALRFTPRVARLEEAWVLEVAASERLFGGREALRRQLLAPGELAPAQWAEGPTCLVALALLRLKLRGQAPPADVPQDLPLDLLSAAAPHQGLLARIGCRGWGQLYSLPRAQLARRFGPSLLQALDIAWGQRPARHAWLQLPPVFDLKLELPALAHGAPELMGAARRLLAQLQLWLRARQLGVLALELEWTLDLKRLDGRPLPPHEQLVVRTARPAQDMAHLRRLVGEQLTHARLSAPANQLRLRTLETADWVQASHSFLPEDNVEGDKLHQLVERLSARLGEGNVLVPRAQQDWRPERMQVWGPSTGSGRTEMSSRTGPSGGRAEVSVRAEPVEASRIEPSTSSGRTGGRAEVSVRAEPVEASHIGPSTSSGRTGGRTEGRTGGEGLYPPWLLPQPLPLELHRHRPWYQGPLRLLTRRQRIETGWWEPEGAVVRDYFVAHSERAGLLWIFCEHGNTPGEARWFLQGLYA